MIRLHVRRVISCAIGLAVFFPFAVQLFRVGAGDIALARELASTRARIVALEDERAREDRTIARLRDPRGAIVEIHERLRFFAPNERPVYVADPAGTAQ